MNVQLGRGELPRPVPVKHDAQRPDVVGAVCAVMGEQRAQDPRHQRLRLGCGPWQQQRGLVSVPDQRALLGLGDPQRPAGLAGRVGNPANGGDQAAASGGGRQLGLRRRVGQQHVQQPVTLYQQVRDASALQPAVHLRPRAAQAADAAGGTCPDDRQHALR